jgi:phosphoribosylformylglycinamidine synthase subunit PurL
VYFQFVNAIKGMSKACRKFQTPVTGGNVSFYNQSTDDGPVFPTPTIGMLGILKHKRDQLTLDFKTVGHAIYMLGSSVNDIASSEYLYSYHGVKYSPAPYFDLEVEYKIQQVVKRLNRRGLLQSAHDVSEGGLFVALAESAMVGNMGFSIETDFDCRPDAFLFGEAQSRIVVTVSDDCLDDFMEEIEKANIDWANLGTVTAGEIIIWKHFRL